MDDKRGDDKMACENVMVIKKNGLNITYKRVSKLTPVQNHDNM